MRTRTLALIGLLVAVQTAAAGDLSRLRVITINVWSGLDYSGVFRFGEYESVEHREARYQALLTQIRMLDPDLLFLQEVSPARGFSIRLARDLGFDEIHQVCNAGVKIASIGVPSNCAEGNAILARPSLKLQKLDAWKHSGLPAVHGDLLSFQLDEAVLSLVGSVAVDSTPVLLVNVHLFAAPDPDSILIPQLIVPGDHGRTMKHWQKDVARQRRELDRLAACLRRLSAETPLIVAGDFNAEIQNPSVAAFVQKTALLDAGSVDEDTCAATWDYDRNANIRQTLARDSLRPGAYQRLDCLSDRPPRRIDLILLNRQFRPSDVLQSRMVLDSVIGGVQASDHFGVLADLNLEHVKLTAPKKTDRVPASVKPVIEPLPILMYDSDTGFGYGAKAFFLNPLHRRESFDLVLFNSTKGERWYRFEFSLPDFELRQGRRYPLAVDVSVDYDQWIHNGFFGVGPQARYADREYYTREPLTVSVALSRGFTPRLVGQAGLRLTTVRNSDFEAESRLVNLPPTQNRSRVTYHSLFVGGRYDSRDSYINPSRGVLIGGEVEYAPESSLTNVALARWSVESQTYSVLFYPRTILATRISLQRLEGRDLPVQVLLPVGGGSRLRGFAQDRFLDKTAGLLNAEIRFPIYWRFGGIAGFDAGRVWPELKQIGWNRWERNAVAGLRFYMNTYVVRVDAGFSREMTGIYFNFGHMF